jgi:predicted nucleic acid-binding Zn ribbon protein
MKKIISDIAEFLLVMIIVFFLLVLMVVLKPYA